MDLSLFHNYVLEELDDAFAKRGREPKFVNIINRMYWSTKRLAREEKKLSFLYGGIEK
jgi:hypothetical protein